MTNVPEDLVYTKEHEWARIDGAEVVVGITDYAQDQLGDVVFVSLPEPGAEVTAGQAFGEVESTKSVSDVYSPVSGRVVAKNDEVEQKPELVNDDPYGAGWLVRIDAGEAPLAGLLDAASYRAHVEGH